MEVPVSFNGAGAFQINSAGQPVVGGTTIDATVHNALTTDIAGGLTNVICKDGQTTITANLPMNNKKLTGMADGSSRSDSATIGNITDGTGSYSATVTGTADAIVLTPAPPITAYVAGQTFRFITSGTNTGAVTVAISGLAAKSITKLGTTALAAGDLLVSTMASITYDGTRFILASPSADVTLTGTQTLTNKTLTAPVLSGTATGTYTLAGTPTISSSLNLTGGNIVFPASQVASAGANTLDDYEEGPWTPSVGGTATYTNQLGSYIKIGRSVTLNGRLTINVIGTGSTFAITGIPFASDAAVAGALAVSSSSNLALSVVSISIIVNGSTLQISSRTAASVSDGLNSVLGSNANVSFSGSYVSA